ncbi:magnesium transporter [Colwellia sp. PAMC 20917]|uniref:magnesium transporter n=1 Tax=Colwellia sp. PAMC 20917 TaxID=1816218 RepID=UPI000878FF45|nr:magnesium transporter [Colwellia sp. PAMC 20917]AOW75874.1 magnesium transporter [Colwellia sp. PAMC 20917]
MLSAQQSVKETTQLLSQAFLLNYPLKSARYLETFAIEDAAELLEQQTVITTLGLWKYIPPGAADSIFCQLSEQYSNNLLSHMDSHLAAALISRQSDEQQDRIFKQLSTALVDDLKELLIYPVNSAARLMNRQVNVFYQDLKASQALNALKQRAFSGQDVMYIQDNDQILVGEVDIADLLKANANTTLLSLAKPVKTTLNALDSKELVIEKFEGYRCRAIPVLDAHQQILGFIRFFDVYQTTKEDLASDMQTMVGVSKDERALSTSWFAVKKRMPWLQINLLTAFAAAAVVGAFEGLISEVTALAILLPVAAGQSGNAGAQALAVTMRGLTLREITTKQWRQVLMKEMATGLLNGLATAVTCSIAVYLWSQSLGLAIVIALAMVSSLVIAGSAGAVVPILLKKLGMDPAQSSSIVLTTITDIAGFMSFLGIALLLSDMLPRG